MVLFFPIIAAIPTVIGISQGIAEQRREKDGTSTTPEVEKEQMRKFTLECYCEQNGKRAREVHGGKVVLRGGKAWIASKDQNSYQPPSHPLTGFYIQYPDPNMPPTLGLVSSISDDPPMLNWVYIDRSTREFKYGNRTQSREHIVGPWGWEAGEEGGAGGLTLGGNEGGVLVWMDAKESEDGGWKVLWEGEDGEEIKGGMRISLERRWIEDEEPKREDKEVFNGKIAKGKPDEDWKKDHNRDEDEGRTETTFQLTHTSCLKKKNRE